jgi:hypothetical protein
MIVTLEVAAAEAARDETDPFSVPLKRLFVLAALGGAGGVLTLFFDNFFRAWEPEQWHAVRAGPYTVWVLLIGLQAAVWGAALAPLWRTVKPLFPYWEKGKGDLVFLTLAFALAVVVGIGAGPFLVHIPNFLPWHEWKLLGLSAVGGSVGLLAVFGMWLAHVRLRGMAGEPVTDASVDDFLAVRETLHNLLLFVGALIGLAILAAGGERQAVAAYSELTKVKDPGRFPPEYVLVYGIYFTALLALAYVPVHLTLSRVGGRLRDHYFPLPPPSDESWSEICGKRDAFDGLLQLRTGPGATLKASVAILTPLIGSMTGLLLGT